MVNKVKKKKQPHFLKPVVIIGNAVNPQESDIVFYDCGKAQGFF